MTGSLLTGVERRFAEDDVIVTKTDLGGRITYANEVFLNISSLSEKRAIGAPHNVIRHPDMPAGVFRLLWQTIKQGREIFAYVLNRATNGDHYWVFAHVTPSFDQAANLVGYHSNRRVPDRKLVSQVIEPLYADLLKVEKAAGIDASIVRLGEILKNKDMDYERFIFSLQA